ncbi:MAG: pyridoxal-phosphate dependent enzyme, partial [Pseudorhodobacter sp.]
AANPAILCVAVEPEGSEPLAGKAVIKPRHIVQGTGYGMVPPHWDAGLMDISLSVADAEVEHWHHQLACREGLYVGFSAAANVCAAAKLLASGRLGGNATVATVLCDTGLKY